MDRYLFADKKLEDGSELKYYIVEKENQDMFTYGIAIWMGYKKEGILYLQEKTLFDICGKREEVWDLAFDISNHKITPKELDGYLERK